MVRKCKDVTVEPSASLLPVTDLNSKNMTNTQDEARLDISAVYYIWVVVVTSKTTIYKNKGIK